MFLNVAADLVLSAWLIEVTPAELWQADAAPGESPEEFAARLDAAADIRADLVAEAAAGGVGLR